MKTHRPLFSPIVLSLLVGIMWGLVLGGSSALAASTTTTVEIRGTVDGLPESVYLTGVAEITSTLMTSTTFGTPPGVMLDIDIHDVSGVGLTTSAGYVAAAQDSMLRRLAASDVIEVTFAFYKSSDGVASARSALASFTLSFDMNTGAVTQGTGTVSAPDL